MGPDGLASEAVDRREPARHGPRGGVDREGNERVFLSALDGPGPTVPAQILGLDDLGRRWRVLPGVPGMAATAG